MNRLFGFPIVDEDKSIENVRKIAVFEPLTEEQLRRSSLGMRRSTAVLTKYYVLAYIRKKGRWPSLEDAGCSTVIREWKEANIRTPTSSKIAGLSLRNGGRSWQNRSLSPSREEYDSVYSWSKLSYQPPQCTTSRRTMLEYLKRGET